MFNAGRQGKSLRMSENCLRSQKRFRRWNLPATLTSMNSKLAALRRKAAADTVEVEDLTAFALLNEVCAASVIRELQVEFAWPRTNRVRGVHVVPLGRWAEVVCLYLEGGCDALTAYARSSEPESFNFAVSVLSEVKTSACVVALAELAADVSRALPKRKKDGLKLSEAINLTLSFKNPPPVRPKTTRELRTFLHSLLGKRLTETESAWVVCALRGVGDEESIRLISALPKFKSPWLGLELMACKAIKKRIKSA